MHNLEQKYTLLSTLPVSHSVCGAILKVSRTDTNEIYALKVSQTRNNENTASHLTATEKLLVDDLLRREIEYLKTLQQELGNLENSHILPMLDSGTWEHDPFDPSNAITPLPAFVMPLGDSSLHNLLSQDREKIFNPTSSLYQFYKWSEQILIALSALENIPQEKGLFSHQDIKPANIVVWKDNLYLIDFGISRHNNQGQQTTFTGRGTATWLAPEQGIPHAFKKRTVNGEEVIVPLYHAGPSVDIYAAGHILYWLTTNQNLKSQKKISSIFHGGDPVLGSEKEFEKVGGISNEELLILKNSLKKFIQDEEDDFLIDIAIDTAKYIQKKEHFLHKIGQIALPDTDYIVDTTVNTIKSMLEVKASERVSATKALALMQNVYAALSPRIDNITLTGPQIVFVGHPFVLTVTVKGQYPITEGPWLAVYVGDERVKCIEAQEKFTDLASIPKDGIFTWNVYCADITSVGTITCRAEVYFNNLLLPYHKDIRVEHTITVETFPEQQHEEEETIVVIPQSQNTKKSTADIPIQEAKKNKEKSAEEIEEERVAEYQMEINKIYEEIGEEHLKAISRLKPRSVPLVLYVQIIYYLIIVVISLANIFFSRARTIIDAISLDFSFSALFVWLLLMLLWSYFVDFFDNFNANLKHIFNPSESDVKTQGFREQVTNIKNILAYKRPFWKYIFLKRMGLIIGYVQLLFMIFWWSYSIYIIIGTFL